jgi:hypothetical protein
MIKKKVKKRKNPYRKDKIDDGINLEKARLSYKQGYLHGLINELKELDHYPFWPDDSIIVWNEFYYERGHSKGVEDSQEQLKLIPKNKLKLYIKELEKEIIELERNN